MIQTDHLDQIMAVMQGAFDPAFGEAWSRRQVDDALVLGNCHYALAMDQDRCAGFTLSRTGVDEEELLLLAVLPAYRRRGIGRQLLVDLARAAARRGALRLLLEMRRDNPAGELYSQFGFYPIGERKSYYRLSNGERSDAVTLACDLG